MRISLTGKTIAVLQLPGGERALLTDGR